MLGLRLVDDVVRVGDVLVVALLLVVCDVIVVRRVIRAGVVGRFSHRGRGLVLLQDVDRTRVARLQHLADKKL